VKSLLLNPEVRAIWGTSRSAWEGNATIPRWALSRRNRSRLPLNVIEIEYCECLSYPLSDGCSYRSLLPGPSLLWLRKLEQSRLFQSPLVSLRVFAVLEAPRGLGPSA